MNDKLCIIPWIHMYGRPDGAYELCCNQAGSDILGRNNRPAAETWNSEAMCDIRQRMLAGLPVKQCRYCREVESAGAISDRMRTNRSWDRYFSRLQSTTRDGQVPLPPIYLDIRFSNLCNHRCRICSHGLSSSWYRESHLVRHADAGHTAVVDAWSSNVAFWEELRSWILPSLQVVYFAGGEPLMQEGHYRMLHCLLMHQRTDVILCYNTNLSTLSHAGEDVLGLWSRFSDVHIWPSVDAVGPRGEYIRKGHVWEKWISNVQTCEQYVDSFSVAVGVYNLFHFPVLRDTLRSVFPHASVDGQLIVLPKYLSIRCFNGYPYLCEAIRNLYREYLSSSTDITAEEKQRFAGWLRFMNTGDGMRLSRAFKAFNEKIDTYRMESFPDTFPELASWYHMIGNGASASRPEEED